MSEQFGQRDLGKGSGRCRLGTLTVAAIGIVASTVPAVCVFWLSVVVLQLDTRERAGFLIERAFWPSLAISLMGLSVVLLTLWHAIRYRHGWHSVWRWVVALVFLQVAAAIWYWVLQFAAATCEDIREAGERGRE